MRNIVYTLGLVALGLFSCENGVDDQVLAEETNTKVTVDSERGIMALALEVSKSVRHKEVRDFIKKKATDQVDGDYDLLLAEAKGNLVDFGDTRTSFEQVLAGNEGALGRSALNTDNSVLSELLEARPLLTLSAPLMGEDYFGEDFYDGEVVPWVVVVPEDFDENTYQTLYGVDEDGNKIEVSVNEPPTHPVLVLTDNERIHAVAHGVAERSLGIRNSGKRVFSNDKYDYVLNENVEFRNAFSVREKGFDRDHNRAYDRLARATFVSKEALRKAESWVLGKPEMRVIVIYEKNPSGNARLESLEKVIDGGWVKYNKAGRRELVMNDLDLEIVPWDKASFGEYMKYFWYEFDGGEDVSYSVSLAAKVAYGPAEGSGKIDVTLKAKDDPCGESLVHYSTPTTGEGMRFNTGIIKFWLNQ
ncbi:hypothetical protein [Fulvitalea axinellae]